MKRDKDVCVCVFFLPIHSGHQAFLDIPAGVTLEEGHTGFFIHSAVRTLIFLARRIQPFLSLVDREVEFCILIISPLVGHFSFLFLVRKIPFAGIELRPKVTSELPGRPACCAYLTRALSPALRHSSSSWAAVVQWSALMSK